jgi:hypothetical protein
MIADNRLIRWFLMPWWNWRLSRLSGIPYKVIRDMTEQEAMNAFTVEPGECPWVGEHTEMHPNEKEQ